LILISLMKIGKLISLISNRQSTNEHELF